MKYHLVYDEQGNIISAGYMDMPMPEALDAMAPKFGPMPMEGQYVAEIEVPEEYAKLDMAEMISLLRVSVPTPQQPTLMFKNQ
ncbi:MAG: hypothetical protein VKL59_02315 [Nostocaceae cyanobacterium]|nr:hypothetical protein [Nostocaceae cyanobacterium]